MARAVRLIPSATLTTWSRLLNEADNISREKLTLSHELNLQVADRFKTLALVDEDLRRKHEAFSDKLIEERDAVYSDLKRAKQKYDATCQQVESSRQKTEKSSSDSRAKRHYAKYTMEMENQKNVYLIQIRISNAIKQKYYHADVPMLLNVCALVCVRRFANDVQSLQQLNELRVSSMNDTWALAENLEKACYQRAIVHKDSAIGYIAQNRPEMDSAFFVNHNTGGWMEPGDFAFEPSPIWHDTDSLVTNDSALVYLRNMITKTRQTLAQVDDALDTKARELAELEATKDRYIANPAAGNVTPVLNVSAFPANADSQKILDLERQSRLLQNEQTRMRVELQTVTSIVGNIDEGSAPHNFRSTSFAIPTSCNFCGHSIWGLTRQGLTCRKCDYTCHAKCEMKVPATCPGTKPAKGKGGNSKSSDAGPALDRTDTLSSTASYQEGTSPYGLETGSQRSFSFTLTMAKALYAYQASAPGELDLRVGDEMQVLDPDDGAGWAHVTIEGREGVVPLSYIEIQDPAQPAAAPASLHESDTSSLATTGGSRRKGPAPPPKRGARKQQSYVRAIYDYTAQTDLEISIHEGDVILLRAADTGNGWAEGELNGAVGQFPANYVEPTVP